MGIEEWEELRNRTEQNWIRCGLEVKIGAVYFNVRLLFFSLLKGLGIMRYQKHSDLPVYKMAFGLARTLFQASKRFPKEETYSLTDQCRRSSRSVCANLAETWRKRRYEAAFINKLSDAEAEAAETQVWIQFAVDCNYLNREEASTLYAQYDEVIAQLVHLIHHAKDWTIKK